MKFSELHRALLEAAKRSACIRLTELLPTTISLTSSIIALSKLQSELVGVVEIGLGGKIWG